MAEALRRRRICIASRASWQEKTKQVELAGGQAGGRADRKFNGSPLNGNVDVAPNSKITAEQGQNHQVQV
jgi:hypothetical protein